MSAPKDGVVANTHPSNLSADGTPSTVDRIPLYEVYMRMAEELAKRSTRARPAEQMRLGGPGELRLHPFRDECAREGSGQRPRQGRVRKRVAVRDVREADHQLRCDARVLSQGVPRSFGRRGAAAGRRCAGAV